MDTGAIIDRFERGGAELRRACAGLSREHLLARPSPGPCAGVGAWSILELVIHLQDMDAIAADRMKRVIAADNPPLLNADENAYVARLFPHEQSLEDALTLFEVGRRQVARTLRQLPDEAFARFGTHDQRGKITLRELVEGYADHLDHHLAFLRKKRERLGV